MLALLDNLKKIRFRIAEAAQRSGRNPEHVRLVPITKQASLEAIKEVLSSGLAPEIGESRVQDAGRKKPALAGFNARWRLIGHLQTNKVRQALEIFDAVDSLDSLRLAAALEKNLAGNDRRLPVLIQVKLSEKETQYGVSPEDLGGFLEALAAHPHLAVDGLMAIAPNVEAVRPHFQRMRGLFDRFFSGRPDAQLSMGMSRDFEIAVEEGATLVRVGSSIFQEATASESMQHREGIHDR